MPSNDQGTFSLTLRSEGVRDLANDAVMSANASVLRSRAGVTENTANVHFADNTVVQGLLPYATGSTEVFNTAVLSGKSIAAPIVVVAVARDGTRSDVTKQARCTSSDTEALGVSQTGCQAVLTDKQSSGSREATVSTTVGNLRGSVAFKVQYPTRVRLDSKRTKLRMIEGWYTDSTCKSQHYQRSMITATADFGVTAANQNYKGIDVTSYVRLESSSSDIAAIDAESGNIVVGKKQGTTAISMLGAGWDHKVQITVSAADEMLRVIGLDVVPVSKLGSLSLSDPGPSYERDTRVVVRMNPPTVEALRYDGDSVRVGVSAVLEDMSRVELSHANGLVLSSTNEASLEVDSKHQKLTVPKDAVGAEGELLVAAWTPAANCSGGAIAEEAVVIRVTPPAAKAIKVSGAPAFVVPVGDTAATKEAGLPFVTKFQLNVALEFADKNLVVTGDERATYEVSDETLFSVGKNGVVTANDDGQDGKGTITVSFKGQNATATISVAVAKYAALEVHAVPSPGYTGSAAVRVTKLAKIECTDVYQQALLVVTMVLSNDHRHTMSVAAAYSFQTSPGEPKVAIDKRGLVRPTAAQASVAVSAKFAGKVSVVPWKMSVTDNVVAVARINQMRLVSPNGKTLTTFAGQKNKASARVMLGVTFTDNRRYDDVFTLGGSDSVLPGLLNITSTQPGMIQMQPDSGRATLMDNSYVDVELHAHVCPDTMPRRVAGSSFSVPSNLDPVAVGDVDLGNARGLPVNPCVVGETRTVEARVNTGGRTLAAFGMVVHFDPTYLTLVGNVATNAVANQLGNVDMKSSVRVKEGKKNLLVVYATISGSKLRGTQKIFTMKFECKQAGLTELSGAVNELIDRENQAKIVAASVSAPVEFSAGVVYMLIKASGTRERRAVVQQPYGQMLRPTDTITRGRQQLPIRQRKNTEAACKITDGAGEVPLWCAADANCDGSLTLEDNLIILDYIIFLNRGNRDGAEWERALKRFQASFNRCGKAINFVDVDPASQSVLVATYDVDRNGVVEAYDSTFLIGVLAEVFYFNQISVAESSPHPDGCVMNIQVMLQGAQARPPDAGTKVQIDVAVAKSTVVVDLDSVTHGSNPQLVDHNRVPSASYDSKLYSTQHGINGAGHHVYTLSLPVYNLTNAVQLGISVVQILSPQKSKGQSKTYTFFHGPPAVVSSPGGAPVYYDGRLEYGTLLPPLIRKKGYAPLKVLSVLPCPATTVPATNTTTITTTTTITATTSTTTSTTTLATSTPSATTIVDPMPANTTTTTSSVVVDTPPPSTDPDTSVPWWIGLIAFLVLLCLVVAGIAYYHHHQNGIKKYIVEQEGDINSRNMPLEQIRRLGTQANIKPFVTLLTFRLHNTARDTMSKGETELAKRTVLDVLLEHTSLTDGDIKEIRIKGMEVEVVLGDMTQRNMDRSREEVVGMIDSATDSFGNQTAAMSLLWHGSELATQLAEPVRLKYELKNEEEASNPFEAGELKEVYDATCVDSKQGSELVIEGLDFAHPEMYEGDLPWEVQLPDGAPNSPTKGFMFEPTSSGRNLDNRRSLSNVRGGSRMHLPDTKTGKVKQNLLSDINAASLVNFKFKNLNQAVLTQQDVLVSTALRSLQTKAKSGTLDMSVAGELHPLTVAAKLGDAKIVAVLLKHGAPKDVVSVITGKTPLHFAAAAGCFPVVELLLEFGADSSIKDRQSMTALMCAAYHGHARVVDLLLSYTRAQLCAQCSPMGYTAMHFAVQGRHAKTVEVLAGYDYDGMLMQLTDAESRTPLHWGAFVGNDQCILALLEAGASMTSSVEDSQGHTAPNVAHQRHDHAQDKTGRHSASSFTSAMSVRSQPTQGANLLMEPFEQENMVSPKRRVDSSPNPENSGGEVGDDSGARQTLWREPAETTTKTVVTTVMMTGPAASSADGDAQVTAVSSTPPAREAEATPTAPANKIVTLEASLFASMNKNGDDNVVDVDEVEAALSNPQFMAVVDANGIDLKQTGNKKEDAARLMAVLDANDSKSISMNEFLQGMMKLISKEIAVAHPQRALRFDDVGDRLAELVGKSSPEAQLTVEDLTQLLGDPRFTSFAGEHGFDLKLDGVSPALVVGGMLRQLGKTRADTVTVRELFEVMVNIGNPGSVDADTLRTGAVSPSLSVVSASSDFMDC